MKKILSIIIITAILCLVVSGCGNNSNLYAKVTYSDGTTETLEVGEIPSLKQENKAAYNNKYQYGDKIEVVDKVRLIYYYTNGIYIVSTQNGWEVSLQDDTPVLSELREEATIKIVGSIGKNPFYVWNVSINETSVTIVE